MAFPKAVQINRVFFSKLKSFTRILKIIIIIFQLMENSFHIMWGKSRHS